VVDRPFGEHATLPDKSPQSSREMRVEPIAAKLIHDHDHHEAHAGLLGRGIGAY
jgi:hypothetical protein